MATGFMLSDGRDLSDIFTAGDAGLTVGFKTSNGTDLGRQFMGGSTGVVTGYKDPSGIDLGSRFGNSPDGTTGWKAITGVPELSYSSGTFISYDVKNAGSSTGLPSFGVYRNGNIYGVSVEGKNSNPTIIVSNASYIWFNGTRFTVTRRDGGAAPPFDYNFAYAENQKVEAQAALNYIISACNSNTSVTAWYK